MHNAVLDRYPASLWVHLDGANETFEEKVAEEAVLSVGMNVDGSEVGTSRDGQAALRGQTEEAEIGDAYLVRPTLGSLVAYNRTSLIHLRVDRIRKRDVKADLDQL